MGKLRIENIVNRKSLEEVKDLITDKQLIEISRICEVFDTKTIKNRILNIKQFIKYGVEDKWIERIDIICNVLKNDVTSDYAVEIRYGKHNLNLVKNSFKEKYGITKERFIKKHGEELGLLKWEEYLITSKTPWGLEACIEKFGKEEGPKKWEERLSKKNKTIAERKKLKPYRNGRTLVEYQNRHGLEEGYRLWKERNRKQAYRFSIKYYIDTYGEEKGTRLWDEYKTRMNITSLNSFIERYGEEIGIKRYNCFVEKNRYANTVEYYIKKYGKDLGKEKYIEVMKSRTYVFDSYSKVSQKLFWEVYEVLEDKNDINFAELNFEYEFYPMAEWTKIMQVDFKYGHKIIEFDGDYWHSKEEQILKDNFRDEYLINHGYEVLRIKEGEYRTNPTQVINECVEFLKK